MIVNLAEFVPEGRVPVTVKSVESKDAHVGSDAVPERTTEYVSDKHGLVENALNVALKADSS